ncbi:hypothetical protein Tsubulata_041679 [Turnera subulata]|uniref:Uncharacterized protein n=1 Tax=Turnera subulata TaxID=218843 RepID=A0A9Q0FUB4_9ROSI|nr:hypothetical protein Tsubulata_041679 [Turnera subulata]
MISQATLYDLNFRVVSLVFIMVQIHLKGYNLVSLQERVLVNAEGRKAVSPSLWDILSCVSSIFLLLALE